LPFFTDTNVKTKLNIFSSSRDIGLIKAVEEWFAAAEKLIDEGKTGMFVSAIHSGAQKKSGKKARRYRHRFLSVRFRRLSVPPAF